ncbi:ABC-type cobalamin/Fe3+-siderophores transport system ATPase subunit [Angulomicrobium tetraedrale]|uniref:ABC-type cobalamin/Fe3+-siderophores transport system ATPase subunit n=1 Tax=Ancylobacter tetraedralis TaxID=217068 RepID=A0A839ZGG1_9HYPH|nr:ABC-type cobalamin/Fe3+-siderophores transport system ATPase subunit [Ancylobacter tetraedralis]
MRSGGEGQRAWLAMMVAPDAECVLLDEPNGALDLAHPIDAMALVQNLCRWRGIGAIVVLHDINLAARFCDEILALRAGRLLAMGFARQVANRVIFMDAGQIIEMNEPEAFFSNPQHERTKLFLSQILH